MCLLMPGEVPLQPIVYMYYFLRASFWTVKWGLEPSAHYYPSKLKKACMIFTQPPLGQPRHQKKEGKIVNLELAGDCCKIIAVINSTQTTLEVIFSTIFLIIKTYSHFISTYSENHIQRPIFFIKRRFWMIFHKWSFFSRFF